MGHFVPSPGMENCPKCFGWQIRDLTKRNAKGWPLEPERIEHCDHCGGKGELPAKAGVQSGWGRGFVPSPLVASKPVEPPKMVRRVRGFTPPPVIDDVPWGGAAEIPNDRAKTEPVVTPIVKVNPWAELKVDKPAEPATGWAVFKDKST